MISTEGLNGVSQLKKQCDLGKMLLDTMNSQKFDLKDGDIYVSLQNCVLLLVEILSILKKSRAI